MTKISICLGLDIQRVNANVTTDLSHFRALGSLPSASALLYSAWARRIAFKSSLTLGKRASICSSVLGEVCYNASSICSKLSTSSSLLFSCGVEFTCPIYKQLRHISALDTILSNP